MAEEREATVTHIYMHVPLACGQGGVHTDTVEIDERHSTLDQST